MARKQVKNGFIEVKESSVASKFHNPSTHEEDTVMKQVWVFTPNMLPDSAEMPKSLEAWQAEFRRIGETLPAITAKSEAEFDDVVETCTQAIAKAYKDRYEKPESVSAKALDRLGFK